MKPADIENTRQELQGYRQNKEELKKHPEVRLPGSKALKMLQRAAKNRLTYADIDSTPGEMKLLFGDEAKGAFDGNSGRI